MRILLTPRQKERMTTKAIEHFNPGGHVINQSSRREKHGNRESESPTSINV